MKLIKCILTNNDCYKANKKIKPKGVMVHSTGCNNPWLKRYVQPNVEGIGVNKYDTDWNRPGTRKCVHAFIGRLDNGTIATAQTLPWDHRGWHCGKSGNDTHISFEICEDALQDRTYFEAVYREAVEFTAYLCNQFDLDPLESGVLLGHTEGYKRGIANNHADPDHWFTKFGKTMDMFRVDVKSAMNISTDVEHENAKRIVQTKCNFTDETMEYLDRYKYAKDLMARLVDRLK